MANNEKKDGNVFGGAVKTAEVKAAEAKTTVKKTAKKAATKTETAKKAVETAAAKAETKVEAKVEEAKETVKEAAKTTTKKVAAIRSICFESIFFLEFSMRSLVSMENPQMI